MDCRKRRARFRFGLARDLVGERFIRPHARPRPPGISGNGLNQCKRRAALRSTLVRLGRVLRVMQFPLGNTFLPFNAAFPRGCRWYVFGNIGLPASTLRGADAATARYIPYPPTHPPRGGDGVAPECIAKLSPGFSLVHTCCRRCRSQHNRNSPIDSYPGRVVRWTMPRPGRARGSLPRTSDETWGVTWDFDRGTRQV